jgi:hypothetical protein
MAIKLESERNMLAIPDWLELEATRVEAKCMESDAIK